MDRLVWTGSTLLIGIFFLWGILASNTTLIINAGIGLGIIQVVTVAGILRDRHILAIAVVLAVHALGSAPVSGRTLYATLPHWDMISHAAGIAAITVIVWSFLEYKTRQVNSTAIILSDWMLVVWAIFIALGVSGLWEILEFVNHETIKLPVLVSNTVEDLIGDMTAGLLGGLFAAAWISFTQPQMRVQGTYSEESTQPTIEWEEPQQLPEE